VRLIHGRSRDLLSVADVAILASGTAALEAGMFAVPMVVLYKVAWLSALVFGHTIEVEHFSMPNHLTDTPVVPELIQQQATAANLVKEVDRLMGNTDHYKQMRESLQTIAPTLAENTGQRAASAIFDMLDARS
jgi:lipid-A-disaccharide synthase